MAQPGLAPQITPAQRVRITNQSANPTSVTIQVTQAVEIHNEDNTEYEIPLSYTNNDSADNYPLSVVIPAGGKLFFIGNTDATCTYAVDTESSARAKGRKGLGSGPYTIIVGSGMPGGKK